MAGGDGFESQFVRCHREWREPSQAVCPVDSVVEATDAMDATGAMQRGGIDVLGGDQHGSGGGSAEFGGEPLKRPCVDGETEFRRWDAEHAVGGGHAQVGGDRELGSRTERRTVDGGDDRYRQCPEPGENRAEVGGELARLDPVQIRPGTERWRRTRQHDRPHVGPSRLDRHLTLSERQDRGVIDRISTLGAIDRDDFDQPVALHPHRRVGLFRAGLGRGVAHARTLRDRMSGSRSRRSVDPITAASAHPDDPVRAKRAKVAKWTLLANRIGYLFVALAMALFLMAFVLGFTSVMATLVLTSLIIGCVLLAPSIILGYAVKAAEREDRERGV